MGVATGVRTLERRESGERALRLFSARSSLLPLLGTRNGNDAYIGLGHAREHSRAARQHTLPHAPLPVMSAAIVEDTPATGGTVGVGEGGADDIGGQQGTPPADTALAAANADAQDAQDDANEILYNPNTPWRLDTEQWSGEDTDDDDDDDNAVVIQALTRENTKRNRDGEPKSTSNYSPRSPSFSRPCSPTPALYSPTSPTL